MRNQFDAPLILSANWITDTHPCNLSGGQKKKFHFTKHCSCQEHHTNPEVWPDMGKKLRMNFSKMGKLSPNVTNRGSQGGWASDRVHCFLRADEVEILFEVRINLGHYYSKQRRDKSNLVFPCANYVIRSGHFSSSRDVSPFSPLLHSLSLGSSHLPGQWQGYLILFLTSLLCPSLT